MYVHLKKQWKYFLKQIINCYEKNPTEMGAPSNNYNATNKNLLQEEIYLKKVLNKSEHRFKNTLSQFLDTATPQGHTIFE